MYTRVIRTIRSIKSWPSAFMTEYRRPLRNDHDHYAMTARLRSQGR